MEHGASAPDERSRRSAEAVLRRIFGSVRPGIRYRLWDGSEGQIGSPDGSFTLVIHDRDTFRSTFGSGNTRTMAEAFVADRIDVEGDLFAALRVANQIEHLDLGFFDRLGI